MSTALVRYGTKRAIRAYGPSIMKYSRYSRRYKIARAAYGIGRMAYRHPSAMKYAARKIQGAWKARRYKHKQAVGRPVGQSNAKRIFNVSLSAENIQERVLYARQIQYPNDGAGIDERARDIINFSGVKLCQEFVITNNTLARAFYLNYAFIRNKKDPTAGSLSPTDFFRANASERARSFTSLSQGIDYHCAHINTDLYDVWFHKRYVMDFDASDPSRRIHRCMQFVKVNRQIRFDASGDPDTRLWVVWWMAIAGDDKVTPSPQVLAITNFHDITYFRETKH